MDKLKPCPFCGKKPFLDNRQTNKAEVKCLNCPAKIEALGLLRKAEAIKAWNRRAK